jgi:hypothetical protein
MSRGRKRHCHGPSRCTFVCNLFLLRHVQFSATTITALPVFFPVCTSRIAFPTDSRPSYRCSLYLQGCLISLDPRANTTRVLQLARRDLGWDRVVEVVHVLGQQLEDEDAVDLQRLLEHDVEVLRARSGGLSAARGAGVLTRTPCRSPLYEVIEPHAWRVRHVSEPFSMRSQYTHEDTAVLCHVVKRGLERLAADVVEVAAGGR